MKSKKITQDEQMFLRARQQVCDRIYCISEDRPLLDGMNVTGIVDSLAICLLKGQLIRFNSDGHGRLDVLVYPIKEA